MSDDHDDFVAKYITLTSDLISRGASFNARTYIDRAVCLQRLRFPDLAAADAYKALLLTDEVSDESGDHHEQAIGAMLDGLPTVHGSRPTDDSFGSSIPDLENQLHVRSDIASEAESERDQRLHSVVEDVARSAYEILAQALNQVGDLQNAWAFADRGLRIFSLNKVLLQIKQSISEKCPQEESCHESTVNSSRVICAEDLPHNGFARREIYLWNSNEIDRFDSSSLSFINTEISRVAPKCEVRAVELPYLTTHAHNNIPKGDKSNQPRTIKQLGLFAKMNIQPNESILREPSILIANNRLHDPLCDACSSPLPTSTPDSQLPTCSDCDDTVFCSETCLTDAQRLYHPAVCGVSDFDISAKDPSPRAATDALYELLLARTIAMAETQDVHPLELREIKYLWGDFTNSNDDGEGGDTTNGTAYPSSHTTPPAIPTPTTPTLPFSFSTNIQTPLHLLEKLNLNIFAPETLARYDTWVINTLMAKYRGVASANMNPRTGMPEVCAVHWRWCLANHSCAPNVRWEWPGLGPGLGEGDGDGDGDGDVGGDIAHDKSTKEDGEGGGRERRGGLMTLTARGPTNVVRWEGDRKGEDNDKVGGIKAGEEILSHYCDIDLPVKERREWAAGALGGECMCERCVWEAEDVGVDRSGV